MSSHTTRAFPKRLEELPATVQVQPGDAFRTFESDPSRRSLSLKRVHSSRRVFSARIGRSYRALALRDGEDWVWFWIGHHSDYDNLINRLKTCWI